MKIAVIGKLGTNIKYLKKDIEKKGFELTTQKPNLVISYGGDGTLLVTERIFPGIPKLAIKNSATSQKSIEISLIDALNKIKNQEYEIQELIKLECSVNGQDKLVCMNDFVIRNDVPTHALRFEIKTNDKKHKHLIGDGVVIATPFGSTGYYNSITRQPFQKGIGLAFNNLTKPKQSLVVNDKSIIQIKIKRRTGVLVADNNPKFINIKEDDLITIKKSKEIARIIKLL